MVSGQPRRGRKGAKALTLRAYARHRKALGLVGSSLHSVQQARDSGRIPKNCFTADGKIADAGAADRAWSASTRTEMVPLSGPTAPREGSSTEPEEIPSMSEARARLDLAKAELAELELAERRGELVKTKDVEARLAGVFTQCKTKLLGIPSRARQQDPTLTAQQLQLVESLIRESLEDLAAEAPPEAEPALPAAGGAS